MIFKREMREFSEAQARAPAAWTIVKQTAPPSVRTDKMLQPSGQTSKTKGAGKVARLVVKLA